MLDVEIVGKDISYFKKSLSLVSLYYFPNNWDLDTTLILPCFIIYMIKVAVTPSVKNECFFSNPSRKYHFPQAPVAPQSPSILSGQLSVVFAIRRVRACHL